jgi:hypothetical protein
LEQESRAIFEAADWDELARLKQSELQLLRDFDGVYSLHEMRWVGEGQ